MPRRTKRSTQSPRAETYSHPEAQTALRPDVGVQGQFKKTKQPAPYRYDSSLSPALEWDGQNAAREQGEALLAKIAEQAACLKNGANDAERRAAVATIEAAVQGLKALGQPFLNWAGKAERFSFDVPTLPLFVHERLSTKAIIETLKGHKKAEQPTLFDLFGDPEHPIADQVLKAYEHMDKWVNRLILGDNLAVMNSLLHFENLGGQVQMIYMDPPYGVKFGSNFQPFVRKRDVKDSDDSDMTREPEMVRAFRDTWEIGVHSYLSCLRDRLLLCRNLLAPSGSIFVQIGDANVHLVRCVLDEVFGSENFCSLISYAKTTTTTGRLLPGTNDYILWYAKELERVKYRQLHVTKAIGGPGASKYDQIELADGTRRQMTSGEKSDGVSLPIGARPFRLDNLTSPRIREARTGYYPVTFQGQTFLPQQGEWKTNAEGIERLIAAGRIQKTGNTLSYVRFLDDFPAFALANTWSDIGGIQSRSDPKIYVVQTSTTAVQRCLLMTTDPGDLALDPTCGSGTTAYAAEQWGRRWISIDVSRVPLALARQRLLTATFPWYELKDEERGPAGGFVYKRKQNRKGEEIGGIVPHVTLGSIAKNEPPAEEVLVDRPEVTVGITRVTGPFVVEGIIPPAAEWEGDGKQASSNNDENFPARMLEVLRKSPVLRLEANQAVAIDNVRRPAKSLVLSAEAVSKNGQPKPVAFVFGPENGPVAERLVQEALREAYMKGYAHLYVIGFAISPNARLLIEKSIAMGAVPATYVQATPDLLMGDLLKTMRSSQIFSVCGLPEIEVKRVKKNGNRNGAKQYQVTLVGLDVFDPVTMDNIHRAGADVPAWFLDTDYNEMCFHVCQAFFPRTGAWDHLKKALKASHEETVWDHLAGATSAPFEAGEHRRISVKVIDDRGNELQVVKPLE
jgi:adenine-specific DNA-methyltransferase